MLDFIGTIIGGGIAGIMAILIARAQTKSQFQLAALDKRLDVHQEAFTLIRNLRAKIHTPKERDGAVLACQEFWNGKCLFLTKQASHDFYWAYTMVWDFDPNSFKVMHDAIEKAQQSIMSGVSLPSIGDVKDLPDRESKQSIKQKTKTKRE